MPATHGTQVYPAENPMHIIGEHYHIYNRGAHKAPVFHDISDYERFLLLLFVMNDAAPRRVDLREIRSCDIFAYTRTLLVEIFSYCLMPNHFHIGMKEIREKGIEKFMHKLCTAYAMYYNYKYDHSGTILQGQYKSKHIDSDEYLKYLIQYIHLNPYGIEEPDMDKPTRLEHIAEAIAYSRKYEYSSFRDYLGITRRQRGIIATFYAG